MWYGLVQHEESAGPLNECERWTGLQPVMYRGVELLQDCLGPAHEAGEVLDFVEVNWKTGSVRLFLDAEDALNKAASEILPGCLPACAPRSLSEYLHETAQFLKRGHSLGSPQCRCKHGMPEERALQLGLSSDDRRTGICTLSSKPVAVTAEELSSELGVWDVRRAQAAAAGGGGGADLWQELHRVASVQRLADGTVCLSSNRLHVGSLKCKADLCRALTDAHSTYMVPSSSEGYPGMSRDIEDLKRTKMVVEIEPGLLHWRDPQYEVQVEPWLKQLWHTGELDMSCMTGNSGLKTVDASLWSGGLAIGEGVRKKAKRKHTY